MLVYSFSRVVGECCGTDSDWMRLFTHDLCLFNFSHVHLCMCVCMSVHDGDYTQTCTQEHNAAQTVNASYC